MVIGMAKFDQAEAWDQLDDVETAAQAIAGAFHTGAISGGCAEIMASLGSLSDARADETVVVHWIGHGVVDAGTHYLICSDSPARGKLNPTKAVRTADLGLIAAASSARRVIVIVDTCYSGAGGGAVALEIVHAINNSARSGVARSFWAISSSHAIEQAVAGKFSATLADVLMKPDFPGRPWSDGDNPIDLDQLLTVTRDAIDNEECRLSKTGYDEEFHLRVFPNPRFRTIVNEIDIETAKRLEGVLGAGAHFDLSARGIEAFESGFFFSGRRAVLSRVVDWLADGKPGLVIVTGPPGSGKSAVVGRLVTMSVPEIRERAAAWLSPEDPLPAVDCIDVAIHAKGKTVFDCAQRLADACGFAGTITDAAAVAAAITALSQAEKRRTIVIDALDEAAEGQPARIVNEIIRPLNRSPQIKLLIGTRRSIVGGAVVDDDPHTLLRQAFGDAAQIIDLGDDPDTEADIDAFVVKRLQTASQGTAEPGWIERAGKRVAAEADANFLYARLVARGLEATPDAPLDKLPKSYEDAFRLDIAQRFSGNIELVTDMLRALA